MSDTGAAGSPGKANELPAHQGVVIGQQAHNDLPADPVKTATIVPGTKNNDANKAK